MTTHERVVAILKQLLLQQAELRANLDHAQSLQATIGWITAAVVLLAFIGYVIFGG